MSAAVLVFSKMASIVITTKQDLKDITLEANDIPGAQLSEPPELCTVATLKRWWLTTVL